MRSKEHNVSVSIVVFSLAIALTTMLALWTQRAVHYLDARTTDSIKQAIFVALHQDLSVDSVDELDNYFALSLENCSIDMPYKMRMIALGEGNVETIIDEIDHSEGIQFKKPSLYRASISDETRKMVEVEFDAGLAIKSRFSPFVIFSIVFNIAILISLYFLGLFLKKKSNLEAAERSFVNVVAHNLKNPLSVVYAASETLSDQDAVKEDPFCKKLVDVSIDKIDEIRSQVESVLNVVRTGDKFNPDDLRKLALRPFVEDLVDSFKMSHPEAKFEIDIDPSHLIYVIPGHVTSVLSVLLDNSLRYCNDVPQIKISSRVNTANGRLSISVQDNGIGFSPVEKRNAFNQYFRGARGGKKAPSGYGLGLYYVKQLTESDGCKVKIESTENVGSTVTIYGGRKAHVRGRRQ